MGNKSRIVNDILPIILQYNENNIFVDLFCGSCSVIQNVPITYERIANDKNKYLIEMLKSLANGKKYPNYIDKETYSHYRNIYNQERKGIIKLTDEQYAEVGVIQKNGKSRDYITEQINNTLSQIPYFKGIEFYSKDYQEVEIPEDSIVYCDIPYRDTKQYETSKDFDYERFYNWCRENQDKYKIFVSEYFMPDDFKCIWQKEVTNSMNTTKTYKPTEKLFVLI